MLFWTIIFPILNTENNMYNKNKRKNAKVCTIYVNAIISQPNHDSSHSITILLTALYMKQLHERNGITI